MEDVHGYWATKTEDGTKAILHVLLNGDVRVRPERVYGWDGDLCLTYDPGAKQYLLECKAVPGVYQVWTVVIGTVAGGGDQRTKCQIEHTDDSKKNEMCGFGILKKHLTAETAKLTPIMSSASSSSRKTAPPGVLHSIKRSAAGISSQLPVISSTGASGDPESSVRLLSRSSLPAPVLTPTSKSAAERRAKRDASSSEAALLNGRWKVTYTDGSTMTLSISAKNGSAKVLAISGALLKTWSQKTVFTFEYDSDAESYAFECSATPNIYEVWSLKSPLTVAVEHIDDTSGIETNGTGKKLEKLTSGPLLTRAASSKAVVGRSSAKMQLVSRSRPKSKKSTSAIRTHSASRRKRSDSPSPSPGSAAPKSKATTAKRSSIVAKVKKRSSISVKKKKRSSITVKKRSSLSVKSSTPKKGGMSLSKRWSVSKRSLALLGDDEPYTVPKAFGPSDVDLDFGDWTPAEWIEEDIDKHFFDGVEEKFHVQYRKRRDIDRAYDNPVFDKKRGPTDIGTMVGYKKPDYMHMAKPDMDTSFLNPRGNWLTDSRSVDDSHTSMSRPIGLRKGSGPGGGRKKTKIKGRKRRRSSVTKTLMASQTVGGKLKSKALRKRVVAVKSGTPPTAELAPTSLAEGFPEVVEEEEDDDDVIESTNPIFRVAGLWKVSFDDDVSAQYTIKNDGGVLLKPVGFHGFTGKVTISYDKDADQYAIESSENEHVFEVLTVSTKDEMAVEYTDDDSGLELEGAATRFQFTSVEVESKEQSADGRFQLGDVIYLCKERHGYVRYIGATHLGAGEMFGVELLEGEGWDSAFNGAIDGKEYFSCAKGKGTLVEMREVLLDQSPRKKAEEEKEVFELTEALAKTPVAEDVIEVKEGLKKMLGRWRIILTNGTKAMYSVLPSGCVQTHPKGLFGWTAPEMSYNDENDSFYIECIETSEGAFQIIKEIAPGKYKVDHRGTPRAMGVMIQVTKALVENLKAKSGVS